MTSIYSQRVEYEFFARGESDEVVERQAADKFFVDIPDGTEGAELVITDTWGGKARLRTAAQLFTQGQHVV